MEKLVDRTRLGESDKKC